MGHQRTEQLLREWREGQTKAERLCAGILNVEGFQGIDPQSPFGGPDGLKDIICNRDGLTWVAACYFPSKTSRFSYIKKKFTKDLDGVKKNNAQAFAFFTNQLLTPTERAELIDLAKPHQSEIYHAERIRAVLDSPKGYGLRLEYLQISMSRSEQISFWSALNYDITRRLLANDRQVERIDAKLNLVLQRTSMIIGALPQPPSSLLDTTTAQELAVIEAPTSTLSLAELCWIHRITTEGSRLPKEVRGRLRSVNVMVGNPKSPGFQPTPPEKLPEEMTRFLAWWRDTHAQVSGGDRSSIIKALAESHQRLLRIHPFIDANGRVARALLDQAAHELLGSSIGRELIAAPTQYFAALRSADEGDFSQLESLIEASLM